ncbi:hypothetical protein SAMN04488103_101359 [Gemmobacter aquatilis]|uniref:Uncharacterized protein n=1 Tax=Gemmobacter aquatilis TaxID=933059 RepID=A0A1H7Z030_9RHOB|nr:hypothetical protein [Gemmobacter aquatilis]SEM51531.1 hypothetical protein SAMN04488103_101359 [Gemmobacter aquatilis]
MTAPRDEKQALLTEQFATTAALSALTGEYHRLLQRCAAAGFARQMLEQGDAEALAEAAETEAQARSIAEACHQRIEDMEQRLNALSREIAALR